ncbi:hypothetical protein AC1031_020490 [Aphanomyces cochlioides]|nr:hypothetical protein AC1031_020490 [Aphanomyces cochlioides]
MDAAYYIKQLEMLPHPEEGGFFSIKHRSSIQVDTPGHLGPPRRAVCSTIHYMVRPLMYIHINAASDISHFWHAGAPIRYFLVNPATYELETLILGPELHKGHVLQFTCPAGWWKGAELALDDHKEDDMKMDFGLLSEAVGPAFDYADNYLLRKEDVVRDAPHLLPTLERFLRPAEWIQPSQREPQADYLASRPNSSSWKY